nr:putative ribonuclease H-like domain-containing protein [Tanacetum cinerariifolium]
SQGATPSNACSQEDDSDSYDEPDVLIIQSTPALVVPIVNEATTQNDGTKSDHATTNADNLDELTEFQALQRQEQAGKEEAGQLGLAFPSLNPILGVGYAPIGSSVSAGSTSLMSPCASPIFADRHSISAGKCHVSAGRPTGSGGRPVSAGKPTSSAGRPVFAGRPTGSAGRPVSAGKPTGSAGRPVSAGRPSGAAVRTLVLAGRILGKLTSNTSSEQFPRASSVENSDIHDGLKIFDCPKSGIFTSSSYDEDFSVPDANNLESSLNRRNNHTDFQLCMFSCFLFQKEPTTAVQALADPDWVEAMQAEMQQFRNQKVWVLVTLPDGKGAIRTKWILKNKRDARGIVCKNKARLVAQGHRQQEWIDYTNVFAPVARIKAIRLFLAFASFIGFRVYQMDVKSAFFYGQIAEEVYVTQPRGFEDLDHPKKVYKVVKALYGLHQALRAWYEKLSTFLLNHRYRRGTIDKTLFIKKYSKDIMLVQVYVDDIICGSTRKDWCEEFETLMQSEFEMSSMGPLTLFLVCATTRHQVTPKTSNLLSVKQIFKYLTANPKLGLWYPRDSPFDLETFFDSDYAGSHGDMKSTIGGCQFLRRRDANEKKLIQVFKIPTEHNVADLLTKIFDITRFDYLVVNIVSACLVCWTNLLQGNIVHLWFLFTSAGRVTFCWLFTIPAGALVFAGHMLYLLAIYFSCWYALTSNLTIYASMVRQFWGSASEVSPLDGVKGLVATIDGTAYNVTEASIRSALQFDDLNAIDTMTNEEIFTGLQDIGRTKFLMYPRFLQLILDTDTKDTTPYPALLVTKKFFANMRNYQGPDMPLLAHMLNLWEPALEQAQQQDVYQPQPSPVVAPHPSPNPMPSPRRQSSPPPIPFGPTPSSGVVFTEPIPYMPSLPEPSEPVLETITSPIRNDDTGSGSFHESSPRPPLRIAALETELKATKILHKDTVVLFAKRIKKLESKLKTNKRKLVLTLHEPSHSTTPSKPANPEQSSEQEISPTTLDAVLVLSQSKAKARAATIIYKRLKKQQSSSGLDFTDAAIPAAELDSAGALDSAGGLDSASGLDSAARLDSAGGVDSAGGLHSAGILVAAGPTVPAEPSSPIRDPSKGKAELKQSIDAEQVYLDSLLAQRVAKEQEKESMASAAQSAHRQAELDRVALNLTNEECIGLVDQVRANPTLSAELLGADIVYDKIRRAVDLATAKDHHQHLKRPGKTLESSESKKLKSSHGTTQLAELQEPTSISAGATIAAGDPTPDVTSVFTASSIPVVTPIAAGVFTTAGASGSASEASVLIIKLLDFPPKDTSLPLDPKTEEQETTLRKSSRKKSIARRRTLPSAYKPKTDALPFDKDDPKAEFKSYLRQASDDDKPAEPISLALVSDITTWEIIHIEFGLSEIHVLTRANGTVKRFFTLRELMYWACRVDLMVLYGLVSDKYKTERATAGDIMYMFVDKKYPLTPDTIQRMLNYGLEIDRDPSDYLLLLTLLVHQRFNKDKQKGFKDDHGASSSKFKIIIAKSMTTDNDGNLKIHPHITTEEHQQGYLECHQDDGLDKDHDKMQKILTQMNTLKIKPDPKDVNVKFLRGLPPSWSGIALILKTKGGLEYILFDDLYNKLKFLEIDTKGYSSSSSTLSNAAFVSTAGSSQVNLSYQEAGNGGHATTFSVSPGSSSSKGSSKSKCSVVDDVIYSFFANHEIDQHLVYEDLDQMNREDFEEYDPKHQMEMLSIKVHRFKKKHGRKIKFKVRENARFDKKLVKCFNSKQMGHFSRECRAQGGQNSNYQKYKSKEVGKDGSDSKAMVVVDGSINWDKQTKEGNTEPRSLENFGIIARIKIDSDADSEGEVVSANDAIPAGVFVSAGDVVAAVVTPQSETEFAFMGLSTKDNSLRLEKAKDRGFVDSGCLRSMSGNKDKLEDFEDFNGGEVTFGGSTGKISGKGTIKTKTLNFENVLYVEELQHFNFISKIRSCQLQEHEQTSKGNARTPQQNRVAERKNRTLIEAARSMLVDSLLLTIFWTEVVATACYVLNRVLVTKPHEKTPYELLTGDKPSISYLKPFGYHVTILNTSDPLGKFDKKTDEGYIVGYFISSKAYRIYDLVSRKIEATMNLKFLENKPFVAGTGQAWMFDIDYLTNSLKYSRVSSTNLTAGSQGATPSNAGSQEDDSDLDDEQDVLIIQSTPTPVVPIVDEATTQNDGTKPDYAITNADNLDELTELQALQRQEQAGNEEADQLRLAFPSLNPILGVGYAPIGSSCHVSAGRPTGSAGRPTGSAGRPTGSAGRPVSVGKPTGSAIRPISAGRPTGSAGRPISAGKPTGSADRPVFAGRPSGSCTKTLVPACRNLGKLTSNTSFERFPRASSVENLDIHDGLKIFDCLKSGIFTSSSYDEDFSGPDANNLESSLHALADPDWVEAMQAEMQQFRNQKVWVLVTLPNGKRAIWTKWILKNKMDARGIVCKNKVRLVAQGHRQEEGIDYTDVFAPVARIEAIRLFLAFASFIGFRVYQMDMKSAFLYGQIAEEVYVTQPRGFEDPDHPKKVYKVVKALYGLHQAPRAWYERLSTFLLKHGNRKGTIDKTLFIKKYSKDIMLVQVYVDDIIFGPTRKDWCEEFETLMHSEFEMNSMGPLTFFLGLQVDQRPDGIFIHQEKEKNVPDEHISVHLYRSMIGCLMYLTATTQDIMFAVCAAARHQVTPKTSNLLSVKQIFKYLTAYPKLGLWYPRDSPFDLEAFSNSDYAGAHGDRKSITGGCQFLGRRAPLDCVCSHAILVGHHLIVFAAMLGCWNANVVINSNYGEAAWYHACSHAVFLADFSILFASCLSKNAIPRSCLQPWRVFWSLLLAMMVLVHLCVYDMQSQHVAGMPMLLMTQILVGKHGTVLAAILCLMYLCPFQQPHV